MVYRNNYAAIVHLLKTASSGMKDALIYALKCHINANAQKCK